MSVARGTSRTTARRLEHFLTYLLLVTGAVVICIPFFWFYDLDTF